MSPKIDARLAEALTRLAELDREVKALAAACSNSSQAADEAAGETDARSSGTARARYNPLFATNIVEGLPALRSPRNPGIPGAVAGAVAEAVAEQAAEEVVSGTFDTTTIASSGGFRLPCGFSGELFVTGEGSAETSFWWNAEDGEIRDSAAAYQEVAKHAADAALDAELGKLLKGGCANPCVATVTPVGERTYSYPAPERVKLDWFTTDVRYYCEAAHKVKIVCAPAAG